MRRAAVLLLLLAGCGSGERTGPSDEDVVRAWAGALSRSDVETASRLFALPSVVDNTTGSTPLVTRRAVRFFNETLPCGADVIDVRSFFGVLVAEVLLTERPGQYCGSGTGRLYRIAFEVEDGRISRWVRLPDRLQP